DQALGALPRRGLGRGSARPEVSRGRGAGEARLGQRLSLDQLRGTVRLSGHDRLVRELDSGCRDARADRLDRAPPLSLHVSRMTETLDGIIRNRVAERLAAGEVALSMQVRLVDSVEIAQIAESCGYDSLYVDIEHSAMSLRQTGQICVAALAAGVTPF